MVISGGEEREAHGTPHVRDRVGSPDDVTVSPNFRNGHLSFSFSISQPLRRRPPRAAHAPVRRVGDRVHPAAHEVAIRRKPST